MFLVLIDATAQCPTWNDTTYYQKDDKVLCGGKAWQALVMIWYWPPPHPIYWKEIPLGSCSGSTCLLMLNLHSQGNVVIDSLPNGTPGTLDSIGPGGFGLVYNYGKTVTLTANPYTGFRFCYWKNGSSNPSAKTISIKLLRDTTIEPIFATIGLCTLIIKLPLNGSVAINSLPDGSVATFCKSDADSIKYVYTENTSLTLIAIPDNGYTFVNWGDAGSSTPKSIAVNMNMKRRFAPVFLAGTTVYKYPSQCNSVTNMKVDGRTRLYGSTQFNDGVDLTATILVRDRSGYGEVANITGSDLWLGTLNINRTKITSDAINCVNLTTRNLDFHGTLHVKNCITQKVRVTMDAFPDFVFDKGYTLKSLDDVEKYYTINKRLENIPSAYEVKENKADLGDLYVRMLQKVEENMLYVIQLQKRVDALKQKTPLTKEEK
jgi:hypothetical protein